MRFIIISVLLFGFAYNAFAYSVHDNDGKSAYGQCSSDPYSSSWSAVRDSGGYWTASGVYSGKFSRSLSEAVRQACGE